METGQDYRRCKLEVVARNLFEKHEFAPGTLRSPAFPGLCAHMSLTSKTYTARIIHKIMPAVRRNTGRVAVYGLLVY